MIVVQNETALPRRSVFRQSLSRAGLPASRRAALLRRGASAGVTRAVFQHGRQMPVPM